MVLKSLVVSFNYILVCGALFLLSLMNAVAQPNNNQFNIDLDNLLKSNRFIKNSKFYKDSQLLTNSNLITKIDWNYDDMQITYKSDSVYWIISDKSNNAYLIALPNDVTLFYGIDRKELQEILLSEFLANELAHFKYEHIDNLKEDFIIDKHGSRHDLLSQYSFRSSTNDSLICNVSLPVFSLVNALNNTEKCSGLYPLKLLLHRYGNKVDTIAMDVNSFINTTASKDWNKWYILEDDELVVLIQHPYIGFDHMLYIRLEENNVDGKPYWLADMHAFIPSFNLHDIFKEYTKGDRKDLIKLKE